MLTGMTKTQAQNFMTSIYQGIYQRNPGDMSYLSTYINDLESGAFNEDDVIRIYLGIKPTPTGTIATEYPNSQSDIQHWTKIGGEQGFLNALDSNLVYHEPSTSTQSSVPSPTPLPPTTVTSGGSPSLPGGPSIAPVPGSTPTTTVQGQPSNSTNSFSGGTTPTVFGLPDLSFNGFSISSTEVYIGLGAAALALLFFGSRR